MHFTEGIILKKEPYGEAGLTVTILTKDFGKIKVMAQGVLKEAAKLKGHIEPLTHSAVSFVIGRNFYRLTSAQTSNFFENMRQDAGKLKIAFYIINLINFNAFEERGDERLFCLAKEVFLRLDKADAEDFQGLEKIFFEFNAGFLHIFGLLPSSGITQGLIKSTVADHFGAKYDIMELT